MEENTQKTAKTELTYEQLNAVATQLSQQNAQLRKQIEEMNYVNLFKRLDYLFKVVEFADKFSAPFVDTCIAEINTLLSDSEEETIEE